MADASGPDTDSILRFHTRLERLSVGTAHKLAADLEAVIAEISDELSGFDSFDVSRARLRLQTLRQNLASYRETVRKGVATALGDLLSVTVETTATNLAAAGFINAAPPVALLARIGIGEKEFRGRTWRRWGAKLADDALERVESDLRRAFAAGETIPKTRKRLEETMKLSRIAADRLARTAINAVATEARIETVAADFSNVVKGWKFVATLDGRTSFICAGLDSTEYGLNDPSIPKPPRHPNCRSVLVPLTRSANKFPPGERASINGPVSSKTDFELFLRRQSLGFQMEYLGPTRYRAFRKGLKISNMATTDRPLSVSELRAFYPDKMAA